MRKTTPIILTMIMLMSAFASIGWSELDASKTSNETDARVGGPDGSITDITEPKQSIPDNGFGNPAQYTIDAGEETNFELFIENLGDADITQMSITVTIYEDADGQIGGALGPIATDANGVQLTWTNNEVICDDAFACPQTTLAPAAVLDGGSHLMSVQGSIVTWTPEVGDYQILVEVDAEGLDGAADTEPDNDDKINFVSVVDWTDIIVDLRWHSGKDVEGGAGPHDFTLSLTTTGSISWDARNITLELDVTGALSNAVYWTDADGDNTTDHSGHGENTEEFENTLTVGTTHVFDEIGAFENVVTWEDGQDRTVNTTDNRWNMRMGSVWNLNGTVTPDGAVQEGAYEIEVLVTNYVIYGKYSPECDRDVNQTGEEGEDGLNTTVTVTDSCEIDKLSDANPATSEDMIMGEISNFHDMSVSSLIINQRYGAETLYAGQTGNDEQLNGFPMTTSSDPGLREGPLQPGLATVQAKVSHNGNNPNAADSEQEYGWNVTFKITERSTGVETIEVATACFNGETPGGIGYSNVGGTFPNEADACIAYIFAPGNYDIVATVSFTLRNLSVDANGNSYDRNSFNDALSMTSIAVLNNRPTVILSLASDDAIIIGEGTEIMFEALAEDVEDPSGNSLVYNWTYPGMIEGGEGGLAGEFDGVGKDFSTMTLNVFEDYWIGSKTVSVAVSDTFSTGIDSVSFTVWNHIVTESTSVSGVKMTYDLTYPVSTAFTINLTDSTDAYTGQSLPSYTATYDSVAVLDYVPSTSYDSTLVYAQSVTIEYDSATLNPTSVWYVDTNGIWSELASTSDVTGTTGTITLNLDGHASTLQTGEIVLMGGELILANPPTAHPMGFTMSATTGGNIGMAWGYTGTYVADVDWVEILLCDGQLDCTDPEVIKPGITMTGHSLSGQGSTTHGTTYYATIRVCNDAGCNSVIGTASATADSEVDGHPTATGITVANGVAVWTVSWTATGDTSDVKNWKVCYDDSPWTVAGDMPNVCVNAADGATSADVTMSTVPGKKKFYFAAVPMDSMGNYDTAVSSADVDYVGVSEDPGQGTGSDVGSTTDVDGAVPSWTWGVIIGIVVVAFVAGAFILSRGGEEGGEGKDWDY